MRWNVAQAKQRFSEVVRAAHDEPQLIFNHDRPVAAVVSSADFEAFANWKARQMAPIGNLFATLRSLCAEEEYVIEAPPRHNRVNAFLSGH